MNVQQASLRGPTAEKPGERFVPDRSSFPQRTAAVTAAAATEADDVDRAARFRFATRRQKSHAQAESFRQADA